MLHTIRKVARVIHRRSVWQVLAVYLLGGWVALRGVEVATFRVGLPGWTPALALALLVLLFPLIMATAVVQGGLGWLRISDHVDPNELPGLTPDQVHVVPQEHPMYGVGVLTWKNAILIGVSGLALFVTSVVAYLTMWALGIGPVGSLLAQGAIEPGEPVRVVDVVNRTDESRLGAWATAAVTAELDQSEVVTVWDPTASAGGDARVRVEGEVARVGAGYSVTLSIMIRPDGTPVARYRGVAASRDELTQTLDALAERVRSKFGESLRAIRAGAPLADLVASPPEPGGG